MILFSIFNYYLCIEAFAKRLKKFSKKKAQFDVLSSTTPSAVQRATLVSLQKSVRQLYIDRMQEEMLFMFVERKVSKRQSVLAIRFDRRTSVRLAMRVPSVATISPLIFKEIACQTHNE